ncbi:MAG: hypothetical protein DDT23_01061 [candidate division WS2 bacterium]|nr:hypothetical protein [Candidatus Lithacetigena glycinireducens]
MKDEKAQLEELSNHTWDTLKMVLERRNLSTTDYLTRVINYDLNLPDKQERDQDKDERVHIFINKYLTRSNSEDIISLSSLYTTYLDYLQDTPSFASLPSRRQLTHLLQTRGFKRSTRIVGGLPKVVLTNTMFTPEATNKIVPTYEYFEAEKLEQGLDTVDPDPDKQVITFANWYLTTGNPGEHLSLPSLYQAFLDYLQDYPQPTEPTTRNNFTRILLAQGFKRSTRTMGGRSTLVLTKAKFTHTATKDEITHIYDQHESIRRR